ncbi:DHHA1 domain-containing protein [Streptomyces sp. NPDC004629]|uniref:DHHA1 domain-containing protein n=1 Tax=Streptomyces sp. NPDC004629 TaxID=3364705 RepID=UPI00368CAA85
MQSHNLAAGPAVVVLALEHSGKALLVAAVSPHLLGRGIQAAQVITRAAKTVGGGGGGALAGAGGLRPEHLDQASPPQPRTPPLSSATDNGQDLRARSDPRWAGPTSLGA